MQYKCPECDKYFRNKDLLNRHMKRSLQKQVKNQVKSTDNEANCTPVKKLDILTDNESSDVGEEFQLANDDDETTYQCGYCGAMLNGELSPCPECGTKLDWSQD